MPMSYNPALNQLEKMIRAKRENFQEDPELEKISTLLDKLLLVQHPEKMEDSLTRTERNNSLAPLAVSLADDGDIVKIFGTPDTTSETEENGFFGLPSDDGKEQEGSNTIRAVVAENCSLLSGEVIALRTVEEIRLASVRVGAGSLVYGVATLSGERLMVKIISVRAGNNIYPVSLEVFDADGLPGISVPGSVNRDSGKESAGQAVSALGLATLDPSLAAQATGVGIQVAKALLNRKIKLVRVSIRAGYQVFLKNNLTR